MNTPLKTFGHLAALRGGIFTVASIEEHVATEAASAVVRADGEVAYTLDDGSLCVFFAAREIPGGRGMVAFPARETVE